MPAWLVLLGLLSLTLAFGYQLAVRRFGWRVLVYWLAIFAAVALFEALAESANITVTRLGDLRLLPDLAGGGTAMGALWLLRL